MIDDFSPSPQPTPSNRDKQRPRRRIDQSQLDRLRTADDMHEPDEMPPPASEPPTSVQQEKLPSNQQQNPSDQDFNQLKMSSYSPNTSSNKPASKTNRFWYDKRWSPRRKKFFWIIAIIMALGLIFGGWYAYRIISGTSGIFTGNYLDLLRGRQPLDRDEFGRSNVLVFGTTEDDESNSAQLLTDSILVISINQDSKNGNIISIPRDLWVEYGQQCPNGTAGKVNAIYSCGIQNGLSEIAASEAFADKISEVIGTDIQYVVKVNQIVLREVVDTLDGVEVIIDSPDPRGIYDVATGLELPNGPVTIDGQTALDLSRARGSAGGYGLPRSNFNREQNQQAIIRGIQREALSTGTLANPNRVIGLADSLGDNVVTNLPSRQIRTVIDIARGTNADDIESIDLVERDNPLVTTGQTAGQSIVLPTAGLFDYSQIHEVIREKFQPSPEPITLFPRVTDDEQAATPIPTTRSFALPASADL